MYGNALGKREIFVAASRTECLGFEFNGNQRRVSASTSAQRWFFSVASCVFVFEVLMDSVRCCSLWQITNALFEVGGQYRRSM